MTDTTPTLRVPNELVLYAQNLQASLQFSAVILKSGLAPQHLKTPEAIYTAIIYGQELGFSPMQAINSIYVIGGKPTLDAGGIKALVASKGGTVSTTHWDDQGCELKMTRPGWEPQSYKFTLEDAKRAGLTGNANYSKNPKAMYYARAVSTLGRNMYADVLKGFYSKEEMQDAVDVTPQVLHVVEKAKATIENKQEEKEKFLLNLIDTFAELGVSEHMLQEHMQKGLEEFDKADIKHLMGIGKKIKSGEAKPSEWFLEGVTGEI